MGLNSLPNNITQIVKKINIVKRTKINIDIELDSKDIT